MDTRQKKQHVEYNSRKKTHEYLTEEKVSHKLIRFLTEDISVKHAFKITLLEERYSKWKLAMRLFKQRERIRLLDEKREMRRQWTPILEESHAYIRWLKCTKDVYMTCVKNSAVLLASGYFVFIYDISTGKDQLYSATDTDGIACIRGSMEEDLFAFAEKRSESNIFVVNYPDLHKAFILRDQYPGKVQDIHFGNNGLLLSLKCNFAEHRVVIWYWRSTYMVCSYVLEKPQIHPELFSVSMHGTYYSLLQESHDSTLLQFWYLTILCDDSVLVKKYITDISLDNYIFHDMQFDDNGILHLVDEKGNLYVYDSVTQRVNMLIPWKPLYPPVDDIVENEMLMEYFLPKRRRLEDVGEVKYVKEHYKEVGESEPTKFKLKKYKFEEVDSDTFQKENELNIKEKKKTFAKEDSAHPCYFVWFKDGVVVSGPNTKLKYYVKGAESGKWVKIWGMFPTDPLKYIVTNQKKDRLFGWSSQLGLREIRPMETSCITIRFFGGSIKKIDLLHPADSFLLTLTIARSICIWRKKTGRLMNAINLEADMQDMTVHQNCPLVVLYPSDEGSIYGIDFTYPRTPTVWPVLKVFKESFAWVKFLDEDWLLACTKSRMKVVLIKACLYDGFEVISIYEFYYEVINMISVLAQDGVYYGVALFEKVPPDSPEVPKGYVAGKMFEVLKFPRLYHERVFTSENFYKNIYTGFGLGNVIAMPGDIKFELHSYCIDIKDGGKWRLVGRIRVEHQVGTFQLHIVGQHYITYGFDGHIFVHDSSDLLANGNKPMAILGNHHRWDEGVNQATMDYKGRYIFSLGQEGYLICSKLKYKYWCGHPIHVPKKHDPAITNPIDKTILKHVRDYEGDFWEDVVNRKKHETDELLAECRVARIKREFEKIKQLWLEYYEQNQNERVENRVSEEFFDLDRERLPIMESVINKEIIRRQNKLNAGLKVQHHWIDSWQEICWGKMLVKLYRIKPFEGRFFIENYSQCIKPYKYMCYHHLIDTLSQMDAAIFPLPDPKMLPWNNLDENNEFPELKLQKNLYQEEEEVEKILSAEDLEKKKEDNIKEEAEEEGRKEDVDDEYEEIEVEEEVEEEGENEDGELKEMSSDDICSTVGKAPQISKEQMALNTLFEEEMRRDDEELRTGPIGLLTAEQVLAFDRDSNEPLTSAEEEDIPDEPICTQEQLKSLAAWKEAELKRMEEGTLTDEQKEALLIQELERLVEVDKKRLEDAKTVFEKHGIEEDTVIEKQAVVKIEKESELGEEEERANEEEATAEEELEEGLHEEQTDLQELEGKLYLESLDQNLETDEGRLAIEPASSETSFTWSEISIEDFPEPEEKVEEGPKPEMEAEEQHDAPLFPSRPIAQPMIEPDKVEEEVITLPPDPLDEPYCMTGSQSPKFVEIDFLRCNEFTCNGIFMSDIHVSKLKGIVEDLEKFYNKMFDDQFLKKAEDLGLIKKKRREILKHIDDLTNVCKVEAPPPPPDNYNWCPGEVPEWIFEKDPSADEFNKLMDETLAKYVPEKKLTEREKLRNELDEFRKEKSPEKLMESNVNGVDKDGANQVEVNKEEEFRRHALFDMMDGVIEMSWQEIIRKGVKLPEFVNYKDPESYSEREQIAVNNYIEAMEKLEEKKQYHANLAREDIKRLEKEIKEIVEEYDIGLMETLRKRMLIESCKQSELLKIARMKLRRITADKGAEHIMFLKSLKTELLDKGVQLHLVWKYLQKKMAMIFQEIDKQELLPSKVERDFLKKLHLLGLPKKSIEHLKSLLWIKPVNAVEFEENAGSNELHAVASYLNQDYKPIYLSEASKNYFKALDELDSLKNCPHNIESAVWEWVVHSRHTILSSNMKIKIYRSYIPELEKITYDHFRNFLSHVEAVIRLEDIVERKEEDLANYCSKMEFQLVLPDALVETHQTGDIEDFTDCVYVSKSYIDQLNQDIMELEKLNYEKLKELDNKMKSVFDIELLHKELRLKIKIQDNLLRDTKFIRLDKYTKDYIDELKASKQEPFESKDYDLIRGERLKKMVRKYFVKYYDVLRKIKKAKEEKKEVIKKNVNLEKTIDILSHANLKAKNYIESAELEIEKPRKDRNEAIMYKAELSRKVEENDKEIERLWGEYEKLQMKSIPHLNVKAL